MKYYFDPVNHYFFPEKELAGYCSKKGPCKNCNLGSNNNGHGVVCTVFAFDYPEEFIEKAGLIEITPAKWIYNGKNYQCPSCGLTFENAAKYRYCPECGERFIGATYNYHICEYLNKKVNEKFRFRDFAEWFMINDEGQLVYGLTDTQKPYLLERASLICDILNHKEEIKPYE